jgi:hypothetical protein
MNNQEPTKPPQVGQSELTDGLDLMPCAHCGGTAALHQQKSNDGVEGGYYIECENPQCRMTTPLKFAAMDNVGSLLAEIWNRRSNYY